MSNRDFHKEFESLKLDAIKELRDRLERIGGPYEFPYENRPIVCAYVYDHPDDVRILSMHTDCYVDVILHVEIVDSLGGLYWISIDDVEGSHIPYIWDYIN
jgi:hypothetical protein